MFKVSPKPFLVNSKAVRQIMRLMRRTAPESFFSISSIVELLQCRWK